MDTFSIHYDGTFDGFLTAVFEIYNQKLKVFSFQQKGRLQESLFSENLETTTSIEKANRVWKSLHSKLGYNACHQLYCAFLSEENGIEMVMLRYIKRALSSTKKIGTDFSDAGVLHIVQTAKMVGREKHRMEAFIRFRLTRNGVYFSTCEPDFNVLPLIKRHFQKRYADQKWIIYDMKRDYGLYYDLENVEIVNFDFNTEFDATKTSLEMFEENELAFQDLWKDYFKSTNIESRKNMKLHIQHVPKRYWKYLSEKQPS